MHLITEKTIMEDMKIDLEKVMMVMLLWPNQALGIVVKEKKLEHPLFFMNWQRTTLGHTIITTITEWDG